MDAQFIRDLIEKLRSRIETHTRQLVNLNSAEADELTTANILRGRIREAESIIKLLMKPEP